MKKNNGKLRVYGILLASALLSSGYSKYDIPEKVEKPLEIESYENFPTIEEEMLDMRINALEQKRAEAEERALYESKIEELSNVDYRAENFEGDEDYVLLGRMLLGECEGCSDHEKIAVAWTVLNRANDGVAWNGETVRDVILAPRQYSAFNSGINPKLRNPMRYNPEEFLEGLVLSQEILDGKHPDPTDGATHYFNRHHEDLRGTSPYWADSLKRVALEDVIHEFYKPNVN